MSWMNYALIKDSVSSSRAGHLCDGMHQLFWSDLQAQDSYLRVPRVGYRSWMDTVLHLSHLHPNYHDLQNSHHQGFSCWCELLLLSSLLLLLRSPAICLVLLRGLLFLLLRSPAISLGFTIVGEIFVYMTIFNPAIEVVTFHFHGWCMLSVCLLPAFTRLGHECQDLLSPCDGMHANTD